MQRKGPVRYEIAASQYDHVGNLHNQLCDLVAKAITPAFKSRQFKYQHRAAFKLLRLAKVRYYFTLYA
jgi:hypothetical protein